MQGFQLSKDLRTSSDGSVLSTTVNQVFMPGVSWLGNISRLLPYGTFKIGSMPSYQPGYQDNSYVALNSQANHLAMSFLVSDGPNKPTTEQNPLTPPQSPFIHIFCKSSEVNIDLLATYEATFFNVTSEGSGLGIHLNFGNCGSTINEVISINHGHNSGISSYYPQPQQGVFSKFINDVIRLSMQILDPTTTSANDNTNIILHDLDSPTQTVAGHAIYQLRISKTYDNTNDTLVVSFHLNSIAPSQDDEEDIPNPGPYFIMQKITLSPYSAPTLEATARGTIEFVQSVKQTADAAKLTAENADAKVDRIAGNLVNKYVSR